MVAALANTAAPKASLITPAATTDVVAVTDTRFAGKTPVPG